MKKLLWVSILIFIFSIVLTRQIVVVQSESEHPITPTVYDSDEPYNYFTDIRNTSDGGFIVIDYRYYAPDRLIKFNENMEMEWEQVFENFVVISDVEELDNGDYMIIGRATINDDELRPYIARLNSEGNLIKNYDLDQNGIWKDHYNYYYRDIEATADGGFIVLRKQTDLIKYDASGEVEWTSTYQTKNSNYRNIVFKQIIQIENHYFGLGEVDVIGGEGTSFNGILVKLDASGDQVWSKTYKTTLSSAIVTKDETITAISADSNYYLIKDGWLRIRKEEYDRHSKSIIKIDAKNGEVIFNEDLFTLKRSSLAFNDLTENKEGELFVAGELTNYLPNSKETAVLLVKYSKDGKKLLETNVCEGTEANSITTSASSDELIIVGKTETYGEDDVRKSDAFYAKLNEDTLIEKDLVTMSSKELFWNNVLVSVRVRVIQLSILVAFVLTILFINIKIQGKLLIVMPSKRFKRMLNNLTERTYDVLNPNKDVYIVRKNNQVQFRIHRHRFLIVVVPVNKSTKQIIKSFD